MHVVRLLGVLSDSALTGTEYEGARAGESLYAQWLIEESLYGGPTFMVTHPDRRTELLSKKDWEVTINVDGDDHIVSYTIRRKVARKEEPVGKS